MTLENPKLRVYLPTNDIENEFHENAPNSFCVSKIASKWVCGTFRAFRTHFWLYKSILSNFCEVDFSTFRSHFRLCCSQAVFSWASEYGRGLLKMSFLAPPWSWKQVNIYLRRTTVSDFWLKASFLKFFSKSQNRIHFLKDLCIKYAWNPRKNARKIQNFHFLQNRSKFILSIRNRFQIIVRHVGSD